MSEYTEAIQISRSHVVNLEGPRDCKEERDGRSLAVSWGPAGKLVSVHTTSGIAGMNKRKRAWPSRVQGLSTGGDKAGMQHQEEG